MTHCFYHRLFALSKYGMLRNNLSDCATFLSIVWHSNRLYGKRTLLLACHFAFLVYCAAELTTVSGITYNSKEAKTYCGVERDNFAAIKRVKITCSDLCGLRMHGNQD